MCSCPYKWCHNYLCTAIIIQKQSSTVARFESPFVHLKSQSGAPVPPSTPNNQLATKTDGSPHKLGLKTEDDLHTTEKKESRKRKKFCPVDDEISLHRHDMKAGTGDVNILTRTVNLRAVKVTHDVHMDHANKCLVL